MKPTKKEIYKYFWDIWHKLDDMPIDMEQFLFMWDALAESYGYLFYISDHEAFAEDINSQANFKQQNKFLEVCIEYFGE